jgi:hypothetical protein
MEKQGYLMSAIGLCIAMDTSKNTMWACNAMDTKKEVETHQQFVLFQQKEGHDASLFLTS